MSANDGDQDVLANLANLRRCDVSERRSRRLRRRCHTILQEPVAVPPMNPRVVPAIAGAWCLAYLVEIIRYTVAVYGRL